MGILSDPPTESMAATKGLNNNVSNTRWNGHGIAETNKKNTNIDLCDFFHLMWVTICAIDS